MSRAPSEPPSPGQFPTTRWSRVILAGDSELPSYAEIAGRMGTTEGAARVAAHRLRRRYGELLRREITSTLADPAEVDGEIRDLFAALES